VGQQGHLFHVDPSRPLSSAHLARFWRARGVEGINARLLRDRLRARAGRRQQLHYFEDRHADTASDLGQTRSDVLEFCSLPELSHRMAVDSLICAPRPADIGYRPLQLSLRIACRKRSSARLRLSRPRRATAPEKSPAGATFRAKEL
jgi:hypothetical protein